MPDLTGGVAQQTAEERRRVLNGAITTALKTHPWHGYPQYVQGTAHLVGFGTVMRGADGRFCPHRPHEASLTLRAVVWLGTARQLAAIIDAMETIREDLLCQMRDYVAQRCVIRDEKGIWYALERVGPRGE